MPGKTTLGVYDDVHHQNAEGLEYDLWRVHSRNNRENVRHDRITDEQPHLLLQANSPNDLGSFEVVLYLKDYFERVDPNLHVPNSRIVVPFGMTQFDPDQHLNIRITPTAYTCTL